MKARILTNKKNMANVNVFADKQTGQKLLVYAPDQSMRGHKKGESHTVRPSEKT